MLNINYKPFLSTKCLLQDHVMLKTWVMAAENSKHLYKVKLYLNAYLNYCKYLFPLNLSVFYLIPQRSGHLVNDGAQFSVFSWVAYVRQVHSVMSAEAPAPCCRCCDDVNTTNPVISCSHYITKITTNALRVFVPHGRCSWSRCAWCTAQTARRSPPPAAAGNAGWTPPHPFSSHCETTSMPPRGCPSGGLQSARCEERPISSAHLGCKTHLMKRSHTNTTINELVSHSPPPSSWCIDL